MKEKKHRKIIIITIIIIIIYKNNKLLDAIQYAIIINSFKHYIYGFK